MTYNPPGRPHPLHVKALQWSINGLARSPKSGRNFGAGLSSFQEIIQFFARRLSKGAETALEDSFCLRLESQFDYMSPVTEAGPHG